VRRRFADPGADGSPNVKWQKAGRPILEKSDAHVVFAKSERRRNGVAGVQQGPRLLRQGRSRARTTSRGDAAALMIARMGKSRAGVAGQHVGFTAPPPCAYGPALRHRPLRAQDGEGGLDASRSRSTSTREDAAQAHRSTSCEPPWRKSLEVTISVESSPHSRSYRTNVNGGRSAKPARL